MSTDFVDVNDGQVVLLIGLRDIDLDTVSEFDLTGNWGGPLERSQKANLVNLTLAGGICASAGVDAADMMAWFPNWPAFATKDVADAEPITAGQVDDVMVANVILKRPAALRQAAAATWRCSRVSGSTA